ncbi:DUF4843 domain-containing protein [Pedobacter nyackensis]|uniref:DUF4843 domain-containing protein n=1 Tax=Pedobacter nyackensis TaxID=475255 RepID=UPI00292DDCFF|nr:DUF4843 domain-containing protein [Pedobacter nyackensis]
MKRSKYIIAFIAIALITSCKQDAYQLFNDVARIQFGPDISLIYRPEYSFTDTLKAHTFYYDGTGIQQDTVFYDIYAVGGASKSDRAFKLVQEQVPNVTNAVAGTHFVAFNNPAVSKHYVIKAGSVHSSIPIIVLRDASLKTTTATLKFNVVANEHFQLGEIRNLWRKLEFTDRLLRPVAWKAGYGKYSVAKHKFMIDTTGERWDQLFINGLVPDMESYYLAVIKIALVDYNNAHSGNPLEDEDGQWIEFP